MQDYRMTPIGVDFGQAPTQWEEPYSKETLRFVFSGTPLFSKGGSLLCDAVRLHLKRHPRDTFLLHVCDLDEHERSDFESLPKECVQLVYEHRKGVDFFRHILSGDVALIPYSPKDYALRTSHILIEALGVGRGVIVSQHPWMQQILASTPQKSGLSMPEWSAEGLAEAMHLFHADAYRYRLSAHTQAHMIRAVHNAQEWWNAIQ